MNQKEFAETIVKCKPTLFCMVLGGTRNLGFEKARTVAHVTGTEISLWTDPLADPGERVKAWQAFKESV